MLYDWHRFCFCILTSTFAVQTIVIWYSYIPHYLIHVLFHEFFGPPLFLLLGDDQTFIIFEHFLFDIRWTFQRSYTAPLFQTFFTRNLLESLLSTFYTISGAFTSHLRPFTSCWLIVFQHLLTIKKNIIISFVQINTTEPRELFTFYLSYQWKVLSMLKIHFNPWRFRLSFQSIFKNPIINSGQVLGNTYTSGIKQSLR